MNQNPQNRKNLIIAGVTLVLLAVVVYYFFNRDSQQTNPLESIEIGTIPSSSVSGIEGDLLATLRELQSLKLSESIFKNSVFSKLVDLSKPLVSQGLPGRSNPFAPVSTSSSFTR